ncbi:hypothetical protein L873DRAFT_1804925 [Choiromyces venosus 120613-1]|uniref:Uncharacterized protein n=1 Tax=Choiromyces venosus 120613-1 TaxID=1336337 RepID=A0A3N4JQB9_9PEZI|nr:hypothetical protein L873DRAFT_1804925 [Choiromyces venosus 120613-1]
MGGKHSHTRKPESSVDSGKNRAGTPDAEKHRTVRLITAPVEIIPGEAIAPESVEVIGGNFGPADAPRNISSSLRAHTSSDSGSETSEYRRSVLRKAYDNFRTAAKNCAADNTSASTADVAGDSDNVGACTTSTPSRPGGRHRCHQSSSLVRTSRPISPRAERIGNALALLATALRNLILEAYHAWCDNGIVGLIKTWIILIACILDGILAIVMRVARKAGQVRRVCFRDDKASRS